MSRNLDKLRKKLKEGKLVKGFFLAMSDCIVSEIAGLAGYDYVWIDAEHGPLDRQEILHHIMAAQGAGCCAFVRVAIADPASLKAILDMGPDGIIFPFVNSKEIAELAVKSCYYPKDGGIRGQGPLRVINYGLADEMEYIQSSSKSIFKIMQIETVEGYENLDEIMSVEGIDSMFIGAADLSRSLEGYQGEKQYELDIIYDDICKRVKEKGFHLGVAIAPTKEDAERVMAKGVDWVVFGQDVKALAFGLRDNLEPLKDL